MFTCATPASLSQCNIGARRSRCEDCIWLSPAQRVPIRLPSRVEQLSRLLRRTGRVGRCGPRTCPCESLPGARWLAAHSAVQWLPVTLPLRLSLPWPWLRPHNPSQEPGALGSARPCPRARQARRAGSGAWRGCFSSAAGDRSTRARTARVMGRWVEVLGAVCSRLWVVLGRAVAQGSEGLFYPRSFDFTTPGLCMYMFTAAFEGL